MSEENSKSENYDKSKLLVLKLQLHIDILTVNFRTITIKRFGEKAEGRDIMCVGK